MKQLAQIAVLCSLMSCESQLTIDPPSDVPLPAPGPRSATSTPAPTQADEAPAQAEPAYAVSQGRSVLWKRYAALERDLMRALDLGRDELCRELGERSCIRDVHLIALGGNDPFGSGIHRPSPDTLATTPIVIDRVLLSACSAAAAKGTVFAELDLAGPAPAAGAPVVDATTRTLFRRLLARDPEPSELAVVASLLDPAAEDAPQSAREFAVLACLVVGSSLEFLFQ